MSEYDLNAELNELPNYELQAELTKQDSYNANVVVQFRPEKMSELINDGDGTSPYATENYVLRHADKLYIHEQGIASNIWNIQHNLDKYPSVTLVDSTETEFFAEVEYNDRNNCTIYLNGATKGKAYLN